MGNIKLSKELVIAVVVIAALLYIGPRITFLVGAKKADNQIESFNQTIKQRQERVTASVESLGIADENFLSCIKAAADERARIHPNSTGGIDDVRELTHLRCPRRKVLSINGVEQLTNLTYLNISRNHIEDISPLQANTALKYLQIDENPIKDIYPLKSLAALVDVRLPELPEMPCDDVRKIIGNISSNIGSINCRKSSALAKADRAESRTVEEADEKSYRLNSSQEQELLDYEFDVQRRYD